MRGRWRVLAGSSAVILTGTAVPFITTAATPAGASSAARQASFLVPLTMPIPSWPASAGVADVTGDGLPDLLVSTTSRADPDHDFRLFVVASQPDGAYAPPVVLPTDASGTDTMAIATGDLDGDGATDVAVGVHDGVDIFWQRNGALVAPELLHLGGPANTVRITDFNLDGRGDLLTDVAGGEVALAPRFTPTGSAPGIFPTAGDVTGDGRPDIVSVFPSSTDEGAVFVQPQNADHTFGAAVRTPYRNPAAAGAAVADLTGDGLADVVIAESANAPDAAIAVFAQTNDHALAPPVRTRTLDMPDTVVATDVNGDGRSDVALAHGGFDAVSVLYQNADGTLGPEQILPTPKSNCSHLTGATLAVADATADGRADLLVADCNHGIDLFRQFPGDAPPSVGFTISPTNTTMGTPVTVNTELTADRDSTPVSGVMVDWGDGTTSAVQSSGPVRHAYDRNGVFPITVTATDTAGNAKSLQSFAHVSDGEPPPDDGVDPTTPASFAARADTDGVHLSWQPSTDDSGIAAYEVLRDGQLIMATTGTEFVDRAAPVTVATTYAVDAVDASGRRSPATEGITVVRPPLGLTVRGATGAGAEQGAVTLRLPAGAHAGDVAVAVIGTRGESVTPPAGWRVVRTDGASDVAATVYTRTLEPDEPAQATWRLPDEGTRAVGQLIVVRGRSSAAAGDDPVDATSGALTSGKQHIVAPSVTASSQRDLVVGFYLSAKLTSLTPPVRSTPALTAADGTPAGGLSLLTVYFAPNKTGATGTRTAVARRAADAVGALVALRP
jgi:hypothetical protein